MQKRPKDEFTHANQDCRSQGNEFVLSPVQIQRSIVCDIIMESNFALEHYAMLMASSPFLKQIVGLNKVRFEGTEVTHLPELGCHEGRPLPRPKLS